MFDFVVVRLILLGYVVFGFTLLVLWVDYVGYLVFALYIDVVIVLLLS